VYTGKGESTVEHGLAYRVVFDLTKHYSDKGYHLFMDNLTPLISHLLTYYTITQENVVLLDATGLAFPKSYKEK